MDEESIEQNCTENAHTGPETATDSQDKNTVPLFQNNELDGDSSVLEEKNCFNDVTTEVFIPECENEDKSVDTLSDSDDSIIFCSDPEVTVFQSDKIEKPKDLLAEISEILVSLSDDERFLDCINFSNKNGLMLDDIPGKRRTSVDLIFTYNILSILYSKLKELKAYFELTQLENRRLKENHIADAEHVAYQVQAESLQKIIEEQRLEIEELKQSLLEERNAFAKEKRNQIEKYDVDLQLMRKKCETEENEKNAAVMKYVKNESDLIRIRKERDSLAKRLKTVENDREDSIKKLKSLASEKASVLQTLDAKKVELATALKNVETLKEELNCKDIKCKWVEENLQTDLFQCKEQNTALLIRINELEDVLKKYKKNLSSNCENSPVNGENHTVNGSCDDDESEVNKLNNGGLATIENENNGLKNNIDTLTATMRKLEAEKLDYEAALMNLKRTTEDQHEKIVSLENQLSEMESLRQELKNSEEKLSACYVDIDQLNENNEDLRQEVEFCREREAELLNFTEKLTAKNVTLQSEYAILEAKKISLETDRLPTEEKISQLETSVASLKNDLDKEMSLHLEEVKRLKEQLEKQTKEIRSLSSRLEEQQAENQSLKYKYSSTIRELTKEVQQYRKCKQFEANECNSGSDSIGLESRTSSCSSLNDQQITKQLEPDRQTLIERILKLQKINAKNIEKIEFMEEHVSHLLAEVKKKNRVIQHYVLREQSGALSSNLLDEYKAEMKKYGGIMASLYNSKYDDGSMTLELSLEINRKLQAVLEDTVLKNITLKENVETLGKEIERLTALNKSNKT